MIELRDKTVVGLLQSSFQYNTTGGFTPKISFPYFSDSYSYRLQLVLFKASG